MEHSGKYQEYLNSIAWKERAESEKRKVDHKCQLCGHEETRLDVHHRTYERLGNERPEDLIVLCPECHANLHGELAPARHYFAELKDCPSSEGNGDCCDCDGYGYIDDDNCEACRGIGKCPVCGGEGSVTEIGYTY